ncbi:MAG: type II toxin-antitoxin system VapC family toxin [Anaerolineae bacterium]|jgi:predicted nucleic acid-binding protein
MPRLCEFDLNEPIFIDANIFLFHAFDDPDYGDAATDFLTAVEEGRIRGVTSPLVLDEVFFKIMVQEAAAELAKPTIWNIRKALKDPAFAHRVNGPVRKYKSYLENLILLGLDVPEMRASLMFAAVDISVDTGLFITDASHVALMRDLGITHIASDDDDFASIPDLTLWKP